MREQMEKDKENDSPCFSLSQPVRGTKVMRTGLGDGGVMTDTYNSKYMENLELFNSRFPCPTRPLQPLPTHVSNMSGTFNNCTFVMSKDN